MPTNDFIEQAIPHEAGHIIVGASFRWIPIREVAVNLIRNSDGVAFGDFATASIEPSDAAIAITPPDRMTEYKLFVAGGLAGNRVSGIQAANESLQSDRTQLARVGSESLEEIAEQAMDIINQYHHSFVQLRALIRERFEKLLADNSLPSGRYTLLNRQEILDIVTG